MKLHGAGTTLAAFVLLVVVIVAAQTEDTNKTVPSLEVTQQASTLLEQNKFSFEHTNNDSFEEDNNSTKPENIQLEDKNNSATSENLLNADFEYPDDLDSVEVVRAVLDEKISVKLFEEKNFTLKPDGHHEESEFPKDLFTEEQRAKGAIIFHIILAVYCFVAIATVCTEYFMPTIGCICQALKLSDDVAAATFMSIATSSPELFTNIIGTFITNSDVGVGHVLGNAYYDMFFVASLGGLAASKEIKLDWWPITRDCIYYLGVAIVLTWVVWDGQVDIHESAILLSLYVLYFIVMFNNRSIIRYLKNKFGVMIVDPVEDGYSAASSDEKTDSTERSDEEEPLKDGPQTIVPQIISHKPVSQENPLTLTKKTGVKKVLHRIGKLLVLPLMILTSLTIPDVRKPRWRMLYPISFLCCVCWIGVSTYLGTWMISVIGKTIGVPDIIMGMVFMAAGGSVVEAYGVYYKSRRGECSIGLSNSMGCNTLDVTMCLALPWLVKSLLLMSSGQPAAINLNSGVLHVNCALLIISVLILFAILKVNRFKLNWRLGLCSGLTYVSVLALAITVEWNQASHFDSS